MSAPRVLLSGVVAAQPMGGVRRHLAELVPRVSALLAARGGELAILAGRQGLPFDPGASTRVLASSVAAHPVLRRALAEGRALRGALASAARAGVGFDLVHTGHLPVPRRLGVPLALTLHDLRALELQSTPLLRRLTAPRVLRVGVARADLVTTVSETVRRQLIERFELAPERVVVIGNGADHIPLHPREPSRTPTVLHVGHVEPRKNLACVIRALALEPGLGQLRLAGAMPDAAEYQRLCRLASELGVTHRVQFLGAIADEQLTAEYASAHALVLPSRLEGFGIPLLEAQRARVPVAYANASALTEVAGGSSYPFAPDQPADCARALYAAFEASQVELESARANAEGHTWDACAERWVRAWEATVAG